MKLASILQAVFDFDESKICRTGGKFAPCGDTGVTKGVEPVKEMLPSNFLGKDYQFPDGNPSARVMQLAKNVFGYDVTPQEMASVAGAPDGAYVWLQRGNSDHECGVEFKQRDGLYGIRWFNIDKDGKRYVKNDILEAEESGTGVGAKSFANEVAAAKAAGFSYISCDAAGGKGDPGYNGFYTWPRMGYGFSVHRFISYKMTEKIGKEFPGAKDILDVMRTPKGREWWLKNGMGMENMRFDLTPGSRSLQVLNAYLEERQKRGKPVFSELLDLDNLDNECLDAAWDRLDQLWKKEEAAFDYDESKHPRGEHGRWGTGGTTTLPSKPAAPQDLIPSGFIGKGYTYNHEMDEDQLYLASKIFGRDVTPEEVVSVAGAPDGSRIIFTAVEVPGSNDLMGVSFRTSTLSGARTMGIDKEGKRWIDNQFIVAAEPGKGVGLRLFVNEVAAARKAGFSYIECYAAGRNHDVDNGYYTWPLIGYDAPITNITNDSVRTETIRRFPNAKTVGELLRTPESRQWWKENGSSVEGMRFDLSRNSRSTQILNAYLEERRKRGKPVFASEETDFDDFDIECLHAVWDRLHQLWSHDNTAFAFDPEKHPHGEHGHWASVAGSVSPDTPVQAARAWLNTQLVSRSKDGILKALVSDRLAQYLADANAKLATEACGGRTAIGVTRHGDDGSIINWDEGDWHTALHEMGHAINYPGKHDGTWRTSPLNRGDAITQDAVGTKAVEEYAHAVPNGNNSQTLLHLDNTSTSEMWADMVATYHDPRKHLIFKAAMPETYARMRDVLGPSGLDTQLSSGMTSLLRDVAAKGHLRSKDRASYGLDVDTYERLADTLFPGNYDKKLTKAEISRYPQTVVAAEKILADSMASKKPTTFGFDPEKHPRGEHGHWSHGTGVASPALPPEADYAKNGIHASSFKSWFGDWEHDSVNASKVVDDVGRPKVVYHGSPEVFNSFDPKASKGLGVEREGGFFFSSSPDAAGSYAYHQTVAEKQAIAEHDRAKDELEEYGKSLSQKTEFPMPSSDHMRNRWLNDALNDERISREEYDKFNDLEDKVYDANQKADEAAEKSSPAPNVMPVYLNLRHPKIVDGGGMSWDLIVPEHMAKVDRSKYDGIIFKNVRDSGDQAEVITNTYAAFAPNQVKSALGNSGAFDPKSNDVRMGFDPEKHPHGEHGHWASVADGVNDAKSLKMLAKGIGLDLTTSGKKDNIDSVAGHVAKDIMAAKKLGVSLPSNFKLEYNTKARAGVFDPQTDTLILNGNFVRMHHDPQLAAGEVKGWNAVSPYEHPESAIVHEAGHAAHFNGVAATLGGKDKALDMWRHWISPSPVYRQIGGPGVSRGEFRSVAKQVSSYAAANPMEMVAEVYAGSKFGKAYSPEVMKMYHSFGGPAVQKEGT